jgi:methionine-rich copper-binding protein CopC/putative copper export protein
MLRRLVRTGAVALVAMCAGAAAAAAHPLLLTSAPAPGSIIPGSPSTLTIAFSEGAVAGGSRVTLTGPHGAVGLGRLTASGGGRQLASKLDGKLAPGVYRAHWVALGDDGHTVSGNFAFGVAEANGSPPPGASAGLGGASTAGRGGSNSSPALASTAALWLGVLASALLWGGVLLVTTLRRRRLAGAERAERRLAAVGRLALLVAVAAAVYGALQEASAGSAGGFDLALLTASGTGISAIARVAVALVGAAVVLAAGRRSARTAVLAQGATGGALLVCYGLSGHVMAQGNAPAALDMAVHLLAAGTWSGGLLMLLLAVGLDGVPLREAARGFAPVALSAVAVSALTGAIIAIREVNHWYFLWFSTYGRLVIVKVIVVAIALTLGALVARRARRGLLVAEAALLAAVVAVGGVLGGVAQGRGAPLPAQSGDLLPGPALTNALLPSGPTPVTLAPARTGMNTIAVQASGHPRSVLVRLVCGCDSRPVISRLHADPGSDGAFSAQIPVPTAGTWNGYLSVDGRAAPAPVALPVGVSGGPGAPVHNVLAVADLSGPGANRCTSFLVGAELAIGRMNGAGGVDGGDKLALEAFDDGGSAARAAAVASTALRASGSGAPVAVLPCGAGAEPAVSQAAQAAVPAIAGDPATSPVPGRDVFRLAADPYADGLALGQTLGAEVLPVSRTAARTVLAVIPGDSQGQRRLAGLRAALAQTRRGIRLRLLPASAVTSAGPAQLMRLLNRRTTIAMVLDGTDVQSPALATAMSRLPARGAVFEPAPVFASDRLLSERFIEASGDAGRVGAVQGVSSVAVDSRDGLTLSQALPALFPGESASLESLRGYVTGLALDYGLRGGTSAAAVAARLERPAPFTDAIAEPWRSDAPAAGAPRLGALEATFLTTTLLPVSSGGEAYTGEYFPSGAWERPVTNLFGLANQSRVPPLR